MPLSNRFVFLLHPCCNRLGCFAWKVYFVPSFGCDQELSPSILPQLRTQWMKAYALNEVRPPASTVSGHNGRWACPLTLNVYFSIPWKCISLWLGQITCSHTNIAYINLMNIKIDALNKLVAMKTTSLYFQFILSNYLGQMFSLRNHLGQIWLPDNSFLFC